MSRTAVLQKGAQNRALAVVDMDFPTMLEDISNHPPTMGRLTRLHGPLAFRKLLGVSAIKMRELLDKAGYHVQHHQVIYTWEKAERTPRDLPRGYWRTRYMPDKALAAYHLLVAAFVAWVTRGVYRARVTGKRIWHVAIRRS